MARTSKTTNPTVTTEITAEKAALITATSCRKCNKPLPNADDQATVSREGKVTCKDCIGKTLPDYVGVSQPTDNPVNALEAALARNTKPATEEPATVMTAQGRKTIKETAAPTTGMVPLSEQLTDEEKKAQKAKPVRTPLGYQNKPTADVQPVAPLAITKPATVVEASDDSAEARRLRAREFIINTVQQAAAGLTDTAFHTEVLKQLARINPPVLSDDKKAEQLETLKRARAIWAEQTAARRAAAAKAKK